MQMASATSTAVSSRRPEGGGDVVVAGRERCDGLRVCRASAGVSVLGPQIALRPSGELLVLLAVFTPWFGFGGLLAQFPGDNVRSPSRS